MDTTNIVAIGAGENYTSYTIPVVPQDNTTNTFGNIFLSIVDGQPASTYLIEYDTDLPLKELPADSYVEHIVDSRVSKLTDPTIGLNNPYNHVCVDYIIETIGFCTFIDTKEKAKHPGCFDKDGKPKNVIIVQVETDCTVLGGGGGTGPGDTSGGTDSADYENPFPIGAGGGNTGTDHPGNPNSEPPSICNDPNAIDDGSGGCVTGISSPLLPLSPADRLILDLGLAFGSPERDWVLDQRNSSKVAEINGYLLSRNKSDEAIEFINEAIIAYIQDGEVDFEEGIISKLSPKANDVYARLIGISMTSSIMNNFLLAFSPDAYNEKKILLTELDKLYKPNGFEQPNTVLAHTITKGRRFYSIEIRKSVVQQRSDVEIAHVLLHEFLHATLRVHQNNEGFSSFVEIFEEYLQDENVSSELHHEIMAEKYVLPLANALRVFDLNRKPLNFYYILAQSGIPSEYRDPNVTVQQILDVITELRSR